MEKLIKYIESAITGLDAIQRAPIVNYDSGLRCLRIQDISQNKAIIDWGFTATNIDNINSFIIKKNDIFIARTGSTIGCSYFANNDIRSVFNNGLIRIRTKNELLLPKYLSYLMQTYNFREYVNNVSMSSATQPNIKINDLLDYECAIPNIKQQQHIVNIVRFYLCC